jgi:hypothetical protein
MYNLRYFGDIKWHMENERYSTNKLQKSGDVFQIKNQEEINFFEVFQNKIYSNRKENYFDIF